MADNGLQPNQRLLDPDLEVNFNSINSEAAESHISQPGAARAGHHGNKTLGGAIRDFQQRNRAYSDVNDFNLNAKTLQDALKRLFGCLAELPNLCLSPCLGASFCLGFLVTIVYLVGICWASKYHIYDLSYDDANYKHHHTTVTMSKSCGNPEVALYDHEHACKYYYLLEDNQCENYGSSLTNGDMLLEPFDFDLMDHNVSSTTVTPDVSLDMNQLPIWEQVCVKVQWFLSLTIWAYFRIALQENDRKSNLFSIKYAGYFIAANVVSWNFRKMGFLSMDSCYILFSPLYPKPFIWGILTVFICFAAWAISVIVCLKRKPDPNRLYKTHLVLRKIPGIYGGGRVITNDRQKATVDSLSLAANFASIAFFVYAAATPAIWLGIVNLKELLRHSGTSAFPGHTMELINYFITTVGQYFLPLKHWYYPFTVAAYLQNLLTIMDIIIFLLAGIRDIDNCCKRRQAKEPKEPAALDA